MNRLETIEAKLKKHIEVLKRAQVEYSCLVHELKGTELWETKGKAYVVAIIIKELEEIVSKK